MILLTGGAGFIGSHTCVELLQRGRDVVILDSLVNSSQVVLDRIERICGHRPAFVAGDVRDAQTLKQVFGEHSIEAVIHFAGLKAVGDSVSQPLQYYDNNTIGTLRLLEAMQTAGVNRIVFSSSATVYGEPESLPLSESHRFAPTSPYGRTKQMAENMLEDHFVAQPDWRIAILRYFNPVGAHESGLIGEDPIGTPGNLLPFVAQVAVGIRDHVRVWGNDYPTRDGTGVRDYLHVMDLAEGHVLALDSLSSPKCFAINLGTGQGSSVLEVIGAFREASGQPLPYQFYPRRPGDVAAYYADPRSAKDRLGWQARRSLVTMCRDHWNWQSNNPRGYNDPAS